MIAALLLYCVNKFTPLFGFLPFGISSNYLNDFLAGVLFPAYVNFVVSFSRHKKRWRIDTLPRLVLLLLACAVVWEVLAPLVFPFYTSDHIDVVCYLSGGFLYWLIQKMIEAKTRRLFS